MLELLLPGQGLLCAAIRTVEGYWRHKYFEDPEPLAQYLAQRDAAAERTGETVFLAQGGYRDRDRRTQANVVAVRSFWFDVDCGPGKPHATQRGGAAEIKRFCEETGLPLPIVVNSGNGLYAHWALTHDVGPELWRAAATVLKDLAHAVNFKADDARTADSASVLRPVGSTNRKGGEAKPVTLVRLADPIEPLEFVTLLKTAAQAKQVGLRPFAPPKTTLNAEFALDAAHGPPAKPEKVFEQCAQVRYAATQQADVEEPLWYALLGLVRHCEDGVKWAHEWSRHHPEYTPAETDKKLAHHEAAGIGPTTCVTFADKRPEGCLGCKHKDKITSPIQLGRVYEAVEEPPPELPDGFSLTKSGLLFTASDEPMIFYDRPLYVADIAWDEGVGYEIAVIRHELPHEGWQEFKIRSSLTNDPKQLHIALADHHIKILGSERKKIMTLYIESYLSKVQRAKKMSRVSSQMGWRPDGRFILGAREYWPDGTEAPSQIAKSVPGAVDGFCEAGSVDTWSEATRILDRQGLEPLVFALCAAAFGAPLMKFSGYPGAVVSLLGPSGTGKTLAGLWGISAYGDPTRLMMLKDDTRNALLARLGTYGTLPLYIDEITNLPPDELSELVYRITQGRDKARLNRAAQERANVNHWQTLAICSTNASLHDRLSAHKQDASPELNRVLEIPVDLVGVLSRDEATHCYRTFTTNFGGAGATYVRHLVTTHAQMPELHRTRVDTISRRIDEKTSATSDERFWSAVAAVTLYGASLAKNLGLLRIDVGRLSEWTVETVSALRAAKRDTANSALDTLGQFLDEHSANRLVYMRDKNVPVVTPHGQLIVRVEPDTNLMYVSRSKLRDWCSKRHASFSALRKGLIDHGVLVDGNRRKTLGAGTDFAGSAQACFVLDLRHPLMGRVAVQAVSKIQMPMIGGA